MAITWRELGYDVLTVLRQNFNDKEITLNHIFYWLRIYGDRLLAQHIAKHETEAYLQVFQQVPVLTEQPTGRKYIVLPESVYDFDNDAGINYISYTYQVDTNAFAHVRFTRTTATQAQRLYMTADETPTPDNPYWYRANNPNVYLLGLECIDVPFVECGLYVVFSNMPCDLDTEIPLPPDLISILQRQVLDLGRFVLQIPADRTNDGTYNIEGAIPKQKIISVNQPEQTE